MDDFQEEWKPVVGFEDSYEVSSIGRVRRIKRALGSRIGHILTPNVKKQYDCVILRKNGQSYTRSVHKLVAEAFYGPVPPGLEINHKDGDKLNNKLDNLEYVTRLENMRHASIMGFMKGHLTAKKKLSDADVVMARANPEGLSNAEMARRLKVSESLVSRIRSGQRRSRTVVA